MPGKADLLPFGDAFGDFDVEGFLLHGGAACSIQRGDVQRERAFCACVGGVNINRQLGVLVFAALRLLRAAGVRLLPGKGGKQVFKLEIVCAKRCAACVFVAEALLAKMIFAKRIAAARCALERVAAWLGKLGIVLGAFFGVGQGFVGKVDFGGCAPPRRALCSHRGGICAPACGRLF